MSSQHSIPRLQPDPDELDFDGLRRRGIALLQDLSGHQWTDYNYHDPGVTLLELLCYGLTDLVYRTDFDVADFLSNEDGVIDYQAQALYLPQQIFPNQAVTDLDLCKLIYDALPDVEDVWIRSHKDQESIAGLFTVFIKPHQSLLSRSKMAVTELQQTLRQQVIQLLSAQRNLARDLDEIHIINPSMFTLAGEIEIDDSRPRAEIYADIYFRCAKLISSGSQILRFEEALRAGMRWEQLFTGPLTNRGYIDESSFLDESYDIDVVKLITLVRHIAGVKNVRSLVLIDEDGQVHEHLQFDHSDANCPVLQFPKDPQQIHALHLVHGRSQHATLSTDPLLAIKSLSHESQREVLAFNEQVSLYLKKYEFEYDAFRRNRSDFNKIVQLPEAQYRDFSGYWSIGEDTPAIYGINHFGVPKSEPPEVHARARQLKAYLYPFEQLMANYLASLQHLRQLYSVDAQLDRSYFSQYLSEAQVPNLEVLYNANANPYEVAKILREQDQFEDRRNRVLDTLLAIYGEQFPSEELKRFDYYHQDCFEHHLIQSKIRLLKQLCELSSQRGNASNLQEKWDGNNLATLQKRIRILSGGATDPLSHSLIQHLQSEHKLISDLRYAALLQKQIGIPQQIDPAQLISIAKNPTPEQQLAFKLPHGAICEALLKFGICWENYQALASSEHHVWLCLRVAGDQYWPLCLLPKNELSDFLAQLIAYLASISLQTEGFHLVEHVLLRPRSSTHQREIEFDFYAHRVSIILPGFTARFTDIKCRLWIENLIAQHLPAHIMPEFIWLDFAFLAQFELRYPQWMDQLQTYANHGYQGDVTALDRSADQVIAFLKKNRHPQANRYWI